MRQDFPTAVSPVKTILIFFAPVQPAACPFRDLWSDAASAVADYAAVAAGVVAVCCAGLFSGRALGALVSTGSYVGLEDLFPIFLDFFCFQPKTNYIITNSKT